MAMKQDQHKVPATYLRQWRHLEGTQDMITTIDLSQQMHMQKIGRRYSSPKSIDSLTTEMNVFDMTGMPPDMLKFLEGKFGEVETPYEVNVKRISQGQITDEDHQYLAAFIGSVLVRSERFRAMIAFILQVPDPTEALRAMGKYSDPADVEPLIAIVSGLDVKHRMNPVLGIAWEYVQHKLLAMKCVFIRAYENRGWFTSDNPVVLKHNISRRWLLTKDTDLYFPMTPEVCLYMYNPDAEFAFNPLRGYAHGTYVQSDEWVHWIIQEMITDNVGQYVFQPIKVKFSEPLPAND